MAQLGTVIRLGRKIEQKTLFLSFGLFRRRRSVNGQLDVSIGHFFHSAQRSSEFKTVTKPKEAL